ncbi:MAG TPA: glycosyltransferase family 4 protein [Gemmatimonadales bacterium]|nr:glycosyltransferase family 4 protein [Gemmatimonadales bacterium]
MTTVMQVLHQGGGAGSVTSTLHLSLGLARSGFHVRFVCPPGSEVEGQARTGGLEVHPIALASSGRLANAAALAGFLDRHPVDLVNSQSAKDRAALSWLALTRRLRVPLVVTRRQMPRSFLLENWLVSRMATTVVAVSRAVGDALIRRGTPRDKLVVIPNGLVTERVDGPVRPDVVAEWRRRIGWEPSRRTIGIVSRPKDQEIVLRALDQVTVPVRLVLAGVEPNGPLGRLAERAPARHAAVCVPFTPDVRALYELLELVLLPSRSEGLSQALLEAMALGKPVIASAATGNLEVVRDGVDGRLVDPLAPKAWGQVIEELLSNPGAATRLGTVARHTARVTYSLDRTVERTADLYRAILVGS